jgi:thioredoxin-related protein
MNNRIAILTLALLLQACSKPTEAPAPASHVATTIAWVKPDGANIEPIFAQAKAANKPVFLYWGAVWCPPCNQIKATVFNRQDFVDRSQLFVPVYLDGDTPGAQQLGTYFKVRGYPTMILFKPDGTELTRLPGEVDANRYMEVLGLGLAANSSVKQSLGAALSGTPLTPESWKLLAYYSWDQDQAQLTPPAELTATLHKLTKACPADLRDVANRLALKAMVASATDKSALPDSSAAALRVQSILNDPTQSRESFDMLVNYAPDLVKLLSKQGSPERTTLLEQWNTVLDKFALDASLSGADRLSAITSKVMLAKLDLPEAAQPKLTAKLLTQVKSAVTAADQTTSNTYERQAIIPNAADLLSEAGLLDESDALLKAELPKAISPYYHMLVLAGNAKTRGDNSASLDWAEQAWKTSKGPATRLQWGSGYVNRLLDMSPQDDARIERAVSGVLADLDPVPETFYERNRRGLEKMSQRLAKWNAQGQHNTVLKKLSAQLGNVCAKLPPESEAKQSCSAVFQSQPKATKA